MSPPSTVLAQLLRYVPRSMFEALARQHHTGQALRQTCRWDQFTALLMAQLSGRQSLRDIEANLRTQQPLLALIGARSSLSPASTANRPARASKRCSSACCCPAGNTAVPTASASTHRSMTWMPA